MSKKILSVVLALALVLTTFAVSAFAVGGTGFEDDNTKTQTWALSDPRDNGNGTYDVDVILTANYVVGTISFQVTNPDAEDGKLVGAELTSVKKGAALTYDANIQKNKTSGLVAIIPEPGNEDEKGADLTNGGVIATLTFTLKAESAEIAIKNDPKTKTNQGGNLIAVRLDDENLTTATWIYGQEVVSVGSTKTLGAVAKNPQLVAKDGTFGKVDNAVGWVYGIDYPNNETYDDVFEVTDGGSFGITPNAVTGVELATGAVLTVYSGADCTGDVVAEYKVIIFGDVNGTDGATQEDAGYICDYEGLELDSFEYFGVEDEIAMIAGDINAADGATQEDAGYICEFEGLEIDTLMDLEAVSQYVYDCNN